MAKMTKAQARKRLNEAYTKITNVMRAGFLTPSQWVKLTDSLNREIKKLE